MSCLLTLAFRRRCRLSRLDQAREVGKITKGGLLGLGGLESTPYCAGFSGLCTSHGHTQGASVDIVHLFILTYIQSL
jgi:hypothetical protein